MKIAIYSIKENEQLGALDSKFSIFNDLEPYYEHDFGSLVIMSNLEEAELTKVLEHAKSNSQKVFVLKEHSSLWDRTASELDIQIFPFEEFDDLDFFEEETDEENIEDLQKHGLDLDQEANYHIEENQRLQSAVDRVYKNEEEVMSDESDDGLKINIPESDGESDKSSTNIEISLELVDSDDSDDSNESEVSSNDQAEEVSSEGDLDFDDNTSGGLSLSGEGDEVENVEEEVESGSDLDLEMSDESSLEFGEDTSKLEQLATEESDSLDLDSADDNDLSLGEVTDSSLEDLDTGLDDLDDLDSLDTSLDEIDASLNDDTDLLASDDGLGDDLDTSLDDDLDSDLDSDLADALDEEIGDSDSSLDNSFEEVTTETVIGDIAELGELSLGEDIDKTVQDVSLSDSSNDSSSDIHDISEESYDVSSLLAAGGASEKESTKEITRTELDYSPKEESQLISSLSSNELLDLRVTLGELKNDRENLLGQISTGEEELNRYKSENLSLKADLDDKKIEVSILKKRHLAEIEELKHALSLSQEKRDILEAKNRSYQKEMDRLGQKMRVDFSQIKQREKELESQLELLSMDSDSKVKSRDVKILELKRKIDSLEFNMESSSIQERQSRKDKVLLEDKLAKVVGTLRNSLNFLEEEIDIELIKKDLDI